MCVCVCVREAQLLQEDANGKDEINVETSLTMAEKYQQTELYHDTEQQLQEELKKLKEGGGWKEESTAAYARNIVWQVMCH